MKTPHPRRLISSTRRGYTLVEVMVATTIIALASIGIFSFFFQALNIYYYEAGKLLVNRDIRTFTSEISDSATYANRFMIFPSYNNLTRDAGTVQNEINMDGEDLAYSYSTPIVDTSVNDGLSGDCLVLIFKDPENDRNISRLVGYFRAPANTSEPDSEGPVRKFDITFNPSSSLPVWQLIPSITDPTAFGEVIELSKGLSNGKLFYNFYNRSIIVKGEIIHRGNLLKRATNTYNFTISPRG
jgi:prepilin-type N-terminal cleavage/methylation domain-containing protein